MSPRKDNKYLLIGEGGGDSPHSNSYGHLPKGNEEINVG